MDNRKNRQSTILVAGGAGYLGIPICMKLLDTGYSVIALDLCIFGIDSMAELISHRNFTLWKGDIRSVSKSDLTNIDCVVDLAGISNDSTAQLSENLTWNINVKGGYNLARAASNAGVKRYIYSSSASVFGYSELPNLNESSPCSPQTIYAKSKLQMESLLLTLQNQNFPVTILRNATVFGLAPRMRFDLVINIMAAQALMKGKIYVHSDGSQCRPFIHISDLVNIFKNIIKAPAESVSGKVFNSGNRNLNMTIGDVAHRVSCIIPARIEYKKNIIDTRSYALDSGLIEKTIGFNASLDIIYGVEEILASIRKNPALPDNPCCYNIKRYSEVFSSLFPAEKNDSLLPVLA